MVYQRKNRYLKNWYGRIIVDTMDVEKSEEDNSKDEKETKEGKLPNL